MRGIGTVDVQEVSGGLEIEILRATIERRQIRDDMEYCEHS
jgi:hypothetical protein